MEGGDYDTNFLIVSQLGILGLQTSDFDFWEITLNVEKIILTYTQGDKLCASCYHSEKKGLGNVTHNPVKQSVSRSVKLKEATTK